MRASWTGFVEVASTFIAIAAFVDGRLRRPFGKGGQSGKGLLAKALYFLEFSIDRENKSTSFAEIMQSD